MATVVPLDIKRTAVERVSAASVGDAHERIQATSVQIEASQWVGRRLASLDQPLIYVYRCMRLDESFHRCKLYGPRIRRLIGPKSFGPVNRVVCAA